MPSPRTEKKKKTGIQTELVNFKFWNFEKFWLMVADGVARRILTDDCLLGLLDLLDSLHFLNLGGGE